MASTTNKGFAGRYLPILKWLPNYNREFLVGDITAGIVVAIMLVPQSMAYASLAGLPAQVGLYASILPLVVYAFLGSSRVLAVGPVAMVSLLTLSGIGELAPSGTAEFIALALLLALLAGLIQLAMGLFRLGFLVNYLSHPVLVGFTSAAAIVIGFSQVKHILGVTISRTERPYEIFGVLYEALPAVHSTTLIIGIVAIAVLLYFKRYLAGQLMSLGVEQKTAAPIAKAGPLVVVLLGTLLVWGFALNGESGVSVVGNIPMGFPEIGIPGIEFANLTALLPIALIISLVGFTESISIATTLASKKRQKVDANQELIALGAANVAASFSGGYPVTGGLSRSAVNDAAGANTAVASIITAVLIVLTVLFLTPLFYFLPSAVLGAIVIVAVAGLFDFRSMIHIWKYDRFDALALFATFFGVLAFSIEAGIGIGAATALLLYLYRTSKPHVAVVGRVGDTEHFRNVLRHEVRTCPETHAVRIDESLYFANSRELENCLLGAAAENRDLKSIVLICSAVNSIDASALETLERVDEELSSAGVTLYLAEVKGPVTDRLREIGFLDKFGEDRIFLSTHLAFEKLGCKKHD
ncbi:MAG: solute carrier family 26 protein [Pyrinomonadaceae bacterium]|nr:solute carrier family 26 protein [Pyrinomonadaceae bacterium]